MVNFNKLKKEEFIKYCNNFFFLKDIESNFKNLQLVLDKTIQEKEKILLQVSSWENNKT